MYMPSRIAIYSMVLFLAMLTTPLAANLVNNSGFEATFGCGYMAYNWDGGVFPTYRSDGGCGDEGYGAVINGTFSSVLLTYSTGPSNVYQYIDTSNISALNSYYASIYLNSSDIYDNYRDGGRIIYLTISNSSGYVIKATLGLGSEAVEYGNRTNISTDIMILSTNNFTLTHDIYRITITGAAPYADSFAAQVDNILFAPSGENYTTENITGNITLLAPEWQMLSFPEALNNTIGLGKSVGFGSASCSNILAGTNYNIGFKPCMAWMSSGVNADSTYYHTNFVLKHDGNYITANEYRGANNGGYINLLQFGFTADHTGTCWIDTGGGAGYPILVDSFGAATPNNYVLYLPDGSQRISNPLLFVGNRIYCTEPENLTAHLRIEYTGGYKDLFVTFSIGYYMYLNGSYNYTALGNDTFYNLFDGELTLNETCIGGDCVSKIDEWTTLFNVLVTPTMLLLYASIIITSLIVYYTKSAILGLIVLFMMLLIMAIIGLLGSWYIYLIIVVVGLGMAALLLKVIK